MIVTVINGPHVGRRYTVPDGSTVLRLEEPTPEPTPAVEDFDLNGTVKILTYGIEWATAPGAGLVYYASLRG